MTLRMRTDNSRSPTGFDSTFQTLQIGAKVSGPVVRDKAWFIISYQHDRSLIALTGVPQARDYDGHYMLAKLTVQPTTEHRLSAFFQTDPPRHQARCFLQSWLAGTPTVPIGGDYDAPCTP